MPVQTKVDPFGQHQQLLDKKTSKGLYIGGIFSIILVTFWFLNEGNWEPDGKTLWGITIMLFASYPALKWAKNSERWIPIFEVAMLIAIPQYAVPLLSHQNETRFYPDFIITKSAALITFYIFISIVGFSLSRRPPRAKRLLLTSLVPDRFYQLSHLGIFISNIYSFTSEFLITPPLIVQRPLGVLFIGLSTISIFITSRLWGLNEINSSKKSFFAFNLIAHALLSFMGLYLLHGFASIFLAIISYSSSSKKIPWVVGGIFISIISILHLGKAEMRGKYWDFSHGRATQANKVDIDEIPSFFAEWIGDGLATDRASKQHNIDTNSSLDRASLFPMICLAVDRIPREKGYLMGVSYTSIPALLIPRILWPEKPTALAANDQLMIHLGLVNPDNITVNIAFGLPTEAYINFGFIGVGILGLSLGFFYKNLSLLSLNASQFSPIGIFSILLISLISQSEQNASIWVSALFQVSAICIAPPLFYKIMNSSDPSSR